MSFQFNKKRTLKTSRLNPSTMKTTVINTAFDQRITQNIFYNPFELFENIKINIELKFAGLCKANS
jgi:hypothetical protein